MTKLINTRHDSNDSMTKYVQILKETSKFEKLRTKDVTTEDELVLCPPPKKNNQPTKPTKVNMEAVIWF